MNMRKVIVIGCTKKKKSCKCDAKTMYSESTLFRKTLQYINIEFPGVQYVILSAKYGILYPCDVIEPYDVSMLEATKDKKKHLKIVKNVKENLKECDQIIAMCGKNYLDILKESCSNKIIIEPMKGLGIGKRLRFLNLNVGEK